ncbi:MAG TPA: helix-turn-helix domain-containing GNAT family N-acetyltransferase [Stellaceae bacterium]|nr:helix-turn-helix domain-containing GNAT family N-acetyltransferase [Stellaceae bacterium]
MTQREARIEAVRRFNRFYTRRLNLLQEGRLYSPYSLAEARVLYELAQREGLTASMLGSDLGLDPGYLSRILQSFRRRGLVARERSTGDARRSLLRLTAAGRKAFAPLEARSRRELGGLLGGLSDDRQARFIAAIGAAEAALADPDRARAPYLLRQHRPGDFGWIIGRHGALYAREYGWDGSFEALVAEIAAQFIRNYDLKCERCWIAEKDGVNVGSVMLVRKSKTVAKLRLLLVEPEARGLGIGARLVEECIRFARESGYRKITLWTNSILTAARHIYERAGFVLVHEEPHRSFGHDLVGETWELAL